MFEVKRSYAETQFEWTSYDIAKGMEDDEYRFYISPSFDFDGCMLCLKLGGYLIKQPESAAFALIRIKTNHSLTSNLPLKCTFGLRNSNGIIEEIGVEVLQPGERECKMSPHPTLSNVMQNVVRQRALKVPISLTVKVALFYDCEDAQSSGVINEDDLACNFKELFSEMLNSDIKICVKGKEFQAHKAILIARSKAFADMLQNKTSEENPGIIEIFDCDPDTFSAFLEYLYCGQLEELPVQSTLRLYETSKKYKEPELNKFCVEVLLENMTIETFCDIVSFGDEHNDSKLMSGSQKFLYENSNDIFKTSQWHYLSVNNSCLSNKLMNKLKEMTKERQQQTNSNTEPEFLRSTRNVTS